MSNHDCNCEQSERLKKELKQTKSERDNIEDTWDNERKMYQAACVERDEARGVAVEMAQWVDIAVRSNRVPPSVVKRTAEIIANWGPK